MDPDLFTLINDKSQTPYNTLLESKGGVNKRVLKTFQTKATRRGCENAMFNIAKTQCDKDCCDRMGQLMNEQWNFLNDSNFFELEDIKKDEGTGMSLMAFFCQNGHLKIIEELKLSRWDKPENPSLVWRASNAAQTNILKWLIEHGHLNTWEDESPDGTNAVQVAFCRQNTEIIEIFFRKIKSHKMLLECITFGRHEILKKR